MMTGSRLRLIAIALLAAAALSPWRAVAQMSVAEAPATGGGSLSIERNQGKLVRLPRPATSVFIANPAIADVSVKSARMVYVFGKIAGTTTLFAVDRSEDVIANLEIVVTHNLSGLEEAIGTLVPTGEVRVASVAGGLVLSGAVPNATDAENARRLALRFLGEGEEVINQLDVTEPNQINLRVKIAEVSRSVMKNLDLNFDIADGDFRFTSGDTFLLDPAGLAGLSTFSLAGNPFGVGTALGTTIGSTTLNILFEALEEEGAARTLAEPNLTTLSGETASFLAGGEFPIPVSQDTDSISIEFKEFGVSLAFTPTLIGNDRISMRVRPEVSQLSEAGSVTLGGIAVPALTTRRAETTIELGSGQSFAVAGLLQADFQETMRKIPLVGDIPILSELFNSEEFERNETELVIIVTPYIVRPVTADTIPLPTDPYERPTPHAVQSRAASMLPGTIPVPTAQSTPGQPGSAAYILD